MTANPISRSSVRRASLVVVLGTFVYLAGDLFDVVGLVTNPYDLEDVVARVAALEAEQAAWDVSHVLQGLGHLIAALGLWMLGRSFARASTGRSGRLPATIASWAGLATAVWAVNSYFAIVGPPVEVAAAMEDPTTALIVTGAIYLVSVLVLFVTLGVTLLRIRHQRWLGWTLIVVGPLAALSIIGGGPTLPTVLMLVLGLALLISPWPTGRGAGVTASP